MGLLSGCFTGLTAQPDIRLPDTLKIHINGEELHLSDAWHDSLRAESVNGRILYEISGTVGDGLNSLTTIKVPPTLSFSDVLRQMVIYYSLIQPEITRERERLLVKPYFYPPDDPAPIRCGYRSPGVFEVELDVWRKVPVPETPKPEERDIYNQVIEATFGNMKSRDRISDKIFEAVAQKNQLPVDEVRSIYREVLLWVSVR